MSELTWIFGAIVLTPIFGAIVVFGIVIMKGLFIIGDKLDEINARLK